MGKIVIEIDDKVLAKALASVMPTAGKTSTKDDDNGGEEEVTVDDIKALCKELGAKVCRPILKEAGFTSPAKIEDDEDPDILTDLYEALLELKEDDGDDEEEVDVDTVKKAVQAYAKENSKADADEILAEFDIKSVRSLSKLSSEDLEELYEAVTE